MSQDIFDVPRIFEVRVIDLRDNKKKKQKSFSIPNTDPFCSENAETLVKKIKGNLL